MSVIGSTLRDPRLPPITAIERKEGGQTVRYTDSEGVNMVFREKGENIFTLARKSSIMDHELKSLRDTIGKADMSLAMVTLGGEVDIPEDMDKARLPG